MKTIDYSDIKEVKRLVKRIESVIQDDEEEFFAWVGKEGTFHVSRDWFKGSEFFCISNTEFDSKGINAIAISLHKYLND